MNPWHLTTAHESTVLVMDAISDDAHAAFSRCLDRYAACVPAQMDAWPHHAVFDEPSLVVELKLIAGGASSTRRPSWLLALHAVKLRGDERPRALLAGHIVNAAGTTGDGKIGKCDRWHGATPATLHRVVQALMGQVVSMTMPPLTLRRQWFDAEPMLPRHLYAAWKLEEW